MRNRLKNKKPPIRQEFIHGTDEQKAAIAKTIDEIHPTTGITISRGEALHLMAGGRGRFGGKWYRGAASGEVFAAKPSYQMKTQGIFNRVSRLADAVSKV